MLTYLSSSAKPKTQAPIYASVQSLNQKKVENDHHHQQQHIENDDDVFISQPQIYHSRYASPTNSSQSQTLTNSVTISEVTGRLQNHILMNSD